MIDESVIFIANISVIGISVILHIGAPLVIWPPFSFTLTKKWWPNDLTSIYC